MRFGSTQLQRIIPKWTLSKVGYSYHSEDHHLKEAWRSRGHYCLEGAQAPTPCDVGRYNPLLLGDEESDCLLCPPGLWCAEQGMHNASGICDERYYCPAGSTRSDQVLCPAGFKCPQGIQSVNVGIIQPFIYDSVQSYRHFCLIT